MTKRDIDKLIYLTGSKFGRDGYTVLHLIEGERLQVDCVPNVDIGNTIVRALRERAYRKRAKYRLRLISRALKRVVAEETFDGTPAEADRRLGDFWNASAGALDPGDYKATLTCAGRLIQTIDGSN